MRDYELVVLLTPDGKQDSILETVKKTVAQNKGKVGKVDEWGKRTLAYPIEKQREAIYFLLNVSTPPEGAVGIERALRLNESVMRHLLVREENRGRVTPVRDNEEKKVVVKKRSKGVKTKKK